MTKDEVIKRFKHYVNTYGPEHCYDTDCFILDMLYGIGSSLDDKYKFKSGLDLFLIEKVKPVIDRVANDDFSSPKAR